MNDETKLPKLAQETIKSLRLRIETALEPVVLAQRKLTEGGHKTSQEIINVLEGYGIFPPLKRD